MKHCISFITSVILIFSINISISGQCPEDDSVNFSSQFDLDTFKLNYPNCTMLRSISLNESLSDPITDLSAFSNIETLQLSFIVRNQPELISLQGVNKLSSCGTLIIENNLLLENINGVESLESVGSLQIRDNTNLKDILGLANLRKSNGRFEIENNASLIDIGSFPILDTINFNFLIENNSSLVQVVGFNNLKVVERSVFSIKNNSVLTLVEGFNALEYVDEGLGIRGPAIEKVSGFNALVELSEDLEFTGMSTLEIIEGFSNLQKVRQITISNNDQLVSIPQFENCQYVEGVLTINNNGSLEALNILNQLDSISSINIQSNNSLITFSGLEKLIKIKFNLDIDANLQLVSMPLFSELISTRDIFITKNDALTSVLGFSELQNTHQLEISQNTSLLSVSDFPSLEYVNKELVIEKNNLLINFPLLESLSRIKEHLWINDNDQIEFINGLNNLDSANIIWIVDNENLKEISGFENLVDAGRFDIRENSNLASIPEFNKLRFVGNYIGIEKNPKLNLVSGFSSLDTINGNGLAIYDNDVLELITGFEKLKTTSDIEIYDNAMLISVSGFDLLDEMRSELRFENNASLISVPTFNSLKTVGRYEIVNNDAIISIQGLEQLEFVNSNLFITQNEMLLEYPDFSKLDTILQGDLVIKDNESLKEVVGFPILRYAERIEITCPILEKIEAFPIIQVIGSASLENPSFTNTGFFIQNNPELVSISGFEKVGAIRGAFDIIDNAKLEVLPKFESLTEIYGNFELHNNSSLIRFDGFENLRRVGQDYSIVDNPNLEFLPVNRKLKTIGDDLEIRHGKFTSLSNFVGLNDLGRFTFISNTQLTSIRGLNNIDPIDRSAVYISDNLMLSDCSLSSLCSFILLHPNRCFISDNAEGCYSCEEIECENISVSGFVFYDFNMNKIKDDNESFIENVGIQLLPDDLTSLSRIDGKYLFTCEEGVSYNIIPDLSDKWTLTTDSSSYNFIFEKGNPENFNRIFGVIPLELSHDILVQLDSEPTRCNLEVDFTLMTKNIGTFSESGQVILCIDERTEFVSSLPEPSMVEDNCIRWDFTSMNPFNANSFEITLLMPDETNTGEPLVFEASVTNGNDVDNSYLYTPEVICSYDPNDKLVMPSGFSTENFIEQEEVLNYTIRFQNEGNAEAINISIEDTLSQLLDMSTFVVTSSSFPVHTYITDNNVKFDFDDIWLPSTEMNEEASHGFVSFSISVNKDLNPLTEIKNEAFIYFDFNAPIQTNETINTIAGVDRVEDVLISDISIIPNPTSSEFCIEIEEKFQQGVLSIFDIKGNHLKSTKSLCMELENYAEGLYLIKYTINERTYTSKLMLKR